jgi:hypothetical protein
MPRAISLILLLFLASAPPGRASDDKAAIRATIANYIEATTSAMLLAWSDLCILTT